MLMIFTAVEVFVLFALDDFWAYELTLLPMLFSLGMIFTVGNTLSMNEGRSNAGGASALVGLAGYIFGAITSPLVGLGNVMHATAIVFAACALAVLACAFLTRRVPADADMAKPPQPRK